MFLDLSEPGSAPIKCVEPWYGLYGAPGQIRTADLLVRSQTLYPTELRAQLSDYTSALLANKMAGEMKESAIQPSLLI